MKRRLAILIVGVVLVGVLVKFFYTPSVVFGDSMLPTYRPWDLCLLQKVRGYEPRRGDVIVFRTANEPPLYFIKRVIGLPGETVAISNGLVSINGTVLAESYTTANSTWDLPVTNVPPGKLYFIGDNRDVPLDLAVQGTVALRLVQARIIWSWRWRK